MKKTKFLTMTCFSLAVAFGVFGNAMADESSNLAKRSQTPISDLVSIPFQNNFHPGVGVNDDLLYNLNIQPVIPTRLDENWSLINRFVFPLIDQPEFFPGTGTEFGFGDFQYHGIVAQKNFDGLSWGFGPVVQFPTASSSRLGAQEWGLGPTFVAVMIKGPWVVGALANNVWSLGNDEVNMGVLQYFVNYNFDDGWYLTSAPVNTVNWNAPSSERWTVPVGLGLGKVDEFCGQPINISAHAFYNIEHPTLGADWQFRLQVQLLFPE